MITSWATHITNQNLTHVVFITDSSKVITSNLTDYGTDYELFQVNDIDNEGAIDFVQKALKMEQLDEDSKYSLKPIGGRFADLQRFIKLYENGLPIKDAAAQMLNEAIIEIRSRGLGGDGAKVKAEWTREQLWETMVNLSETPQISYDKLLFNIFNGNENAIKALVHNNILAVGRVIDSSGFVTAFSPLYREAFTQMSKDPLLRKGMQTLLKKSKN